MIASSVAVSVARRAASSVVVGGGGLQNLLSGDNIGSAPWSVLNGAVAVGNQLTLSNTNSGLTQGLAVAANGIYKLSFYIWGDATSLVAEMVDNNDGSDSATTTISVTSTQTLITLVADYSVSATFSGSLGVYFNRFSSVTAGAVVYIDNVRLVDMS